MNRQSRWRPGECATCRLIAMCPTCAGYNWEVNGDSGTRTTFHCDAFKLEVLASAKLQALRLAKTKPKELQSLGRDELYRMSRRLDVLLQLTNGGTQHSTPNLLLP